MLQIGSLRLPLLHRRLRPPGRGARGRAPDHPGDHREPLAPRAPDRARALHLDQDHRRYRGARRAASDAAFTLAPCGVAHVVIGVTVGRGDGAAPVDPKGKPTRGGGPNEPEGGDQRVLPTSTIAASPTQTCGSRAATCARSASRSRCCRATATPISWTAPAAVAEMANPGNRQTLSAVERGAGAPLGKPAPGRRAGLWAHPLRFRSRPFQQHRGRRRLRQGSSPRKRSATRRTRSASPPTSPAPWSRTPA